MHNLGGDKSAKACCLTCLEKGASFNKLEFALISEDKTASRKEIDKLMEVLPEVERNCEVDLKEAKEHLEKAKSELLAGNYGRAYFHARSAEDLIGFELRGGEEMAKRVLAGLPPKPPKPLHRCALSCQHSGVMLEGAESATAGREERFAKHYISHLTEAIRSIMENCDVDLSLALPEVTKAFYEIQEGNFERALARLGSIEETITKALKETKSTG